MSFIVLKVWLMALHFLQGLIFLKKQLMKIGMILIVIVTNSFFLENMIFIDIL